MVATGCADHKSQWCLGLTCHAAQQPPRLNPPCTRQRQRVKHSTTQVLIPRPCGSYPWLVVTACAISPSETYTLPQVWIFFSFDLVYWIFGKETVNACHSLCISQGWSNFVFSSLSSALTLPRCWAQAKSGVPTPTYLSAHHPKTTPALLGCCAIIISQKVTVYSKSLSQCPFRSGWNQVEPMFSVPQHAVMLHPVRPSTCPLIFLTHGCLCVTCKLWAMTASFLSPMKVLKI